MRPSQARLERRRMHAFTTSDLRLGEHRRWDFSAQAVYVLAWAGLVTVCVAMLAVGAGLGWVLWRVAVGGGW